MSNLIVRDTVSPENMTIDNSYGAVLPYRDGAFRWSFAQVQRFLNAGKLIYPISVLGGNPHLAQIVDCELGDLTPQQAAVWAHNRNQLHGDATIYCNRVTVPEVVDALGMEPCWLHVADWTGAPHTPAGLDLPPHIKLGLVQFASVAAYDSSAIMTTAWPAHPWKPGAGAW